MTYAELMGKIKEKSGGTYTHVKNDNFNVDRAKPLLQTLSHPDDYYEGVVCDFMENISKLDFEGFVRGLREFTEWTEDDIKELRELRSWHNRAFVTFPAFKEEIESLFGEVDDVAVKSLKEIYRDIYDTIYEKGYEHGEEVGRKNGYDEACKDAFGE